MIHLTNKSADPNEKANLHLMDFQKTMPDKQNNQIELTTTVDIVVEIFYYL